MATIKEEIMSIAEAQGYDGDTPSTIAEAVNALGSVIGGGGSGGGSATMVVTISTNAGRLSADKTVAEIVEHIDSGGDVIAVYDESMGAKQSVRVYHMQAYGQDHVTFATFDRSSSGSMTFYHMNYDRYNGVTMQQGDFTPSS